MKTQSPEIRIGARWDDPRQDQRFIQAAARGLLDYIEVTCPFASFVAPTQIGLPLYAHSAENPICSAYGLNSKITHAVHESARLWKSPWIGEHLAFLSAAETGALGYVINPLLTEEFKDVAVSNIRQLHRIYDRPIALELGPIYSRNGDYESEIHFLNTVAIESKSQIILDVTHWLISNRNLGRPVHYGIAALDPDRVIELHVAGIRLGRDGAFWHDAHGLKPSQDILQLVGEVIPQFPKLQAITFEHSIEGDEKDFYQTLEVLQEIAK